MARTKQSARKNTNDVGKSSSVAKSAVTEPELVSPQGVSDMEVAEDVDTRTVVKAKVEHVNYSWYVSNMKLNAPRKSSVLLPRRCR